MTAKYLRITSEMDNRGNEYQYQPIPNQATPYNPATPQYTQNYGPPPPQPAYSQPGYGGQPGYNQPGYAPQPGYIPPPPNYGGQPNILNPLSAIKNSLGWAWKKTQLDWNNINYLRGMNNYQPTHEENTRGKILSNYSTFCNMGQ